MEKEIQYNIKQICEKFEIIKNQGWIKSMRNGSTGIGYTFENLIKKKEDNFYLPDYNNCIEIKTKNSISRGYITLFNANPDGDYLFNIEKIKENYGYPDKVLKNYNIFNGSVTIKADFIGIKYKFKISIDNNLKKVILLIFDKHDNLIDNSITWSFELLEERLMKKLQYLALIKADIKKIDNIEYINYNEINIFKLKNFNDFLELISNGKIRITFKIGVFRAGERIGQVHNHGTGFDINEKNLLFLYDKII